MFPRFDLLIIGLLVASCLSAFAQGTSAKPTDRTRWYRDSLVNVHCDNHSGLFAKGVPVEDISQMLNSMPISMIQVSAQSNGYATYPTQIGLSNPGAEGYDTLRTFRDITRRQGKKLCIYMSVDRRPLEIKLHPEWAALRADGSQQINGEPCVCQRPNRDKKGYLYERFLPQIREIIAKYDPDGLWYDGDYILPQPCWCANCLKEWDLDMHRPAPRDASSPDWQTWVDWHIKRYREYRRLVAQTIHQASPRAMYTSNWSWAWTPEPVPDYADNLSGDAWSVAQVHSVVQRWGAQDTPWDIMSFCVPGARAFNHTYSLQRTLQEGALTMAYGGVWFLWSFGGDMPAAGAEVTCNCAQFARDRQMALGPSESLAQVAVLDSETAWEKGGESGMNGRVHQMARALAESHYLTDIVNEKTLRAHLQRYSTIIVPEHRTVAPETQKALAQFANRGGLLLLTGAALRGEGDEAADTASLLGLKRTAPESVTHGTLPLGKERFHLTGLWKVQPATAQVVASFTSGEPALTLNKIGQGAVAYLAASGGLSYPDDGLTGLLLRALGKGPSYDVSGGAGQAAVVCTLRGKPGQTILHVCDLTARVNGVVEDADTQSYTDYNPILYGVRITLPLAKAPTKVQALPAGTIASSEYKDGLLTVTLGNVQTHAAVILSTEASTPLTSLPATSPMPQTRFRPEPTARGVIFADDFERAPVGGLPAAPWAAESRGDARIFVTDLTAAAGQRSLCFNETENSSFFPFLHRTIPAFRRGRAVLRFDLKTEPGFDFLTEARFEGKGAGPSVLVNGEGKLNVTDKLTLTPGQWAHWEIEFVLGNDNPSYTLRITPQGKDTVTIPNLPYASDWFYRCDSIYFVGSGEKPSKAYLDNVSLDWLGQE